MVVEARVESTITKHAWNADRSLLAVVPNSNVVNIYKTPKTADGAWEKVGELKEHDALVTDVVWAPTTNRIITTSQDRNAYVWTLEGTEWKPMLVILRIGAAATCASWASNEQKFAVGSGSKTVPVCYYDGSDGNNFWVSKMIKHHTSTVVSVAWHPTSPIIGTASTDYKFRLCSAYVKSIDGKGVETPFGANPKFGTLLFEVESHGWVTGVSFAPGGGCVAFCSHDSTVSFVDVAAAAGGAGDGAVSTLRLSELPLSQLLFLQDGSLIGAGHAYDPMMFVNSGGKWAAAGTIKGKAAAKEEASGISATRKMFQAQAATGQGDVQSAAAKLDSMHQNLVCGLQQFGGSFGGVAAEFTSSSLDGKIVWWTRDELTAAMKGLKL
jgi:actin related protein 2/3 complex subunit 1A/1B